MKKNINSIKIIIEIIIKTVDILNKSIFIYEEIKIKN